MTLKRRPFTALGWSLALCSCGTVSCALPCFACHVRQRELRALEAELRKHGGL